MSSNEIYPYQCPLLFDGAFGLTEANHSIKLCPIGSKVRRNLVGHFTIKHNLKKIHARRLYDAIKNNQNPRTEILFSENEDVIDHGRFIPCPFSYSMINGTECHAPPSRKIPCSYDSITIFCLVRHLTKYHDFPLHIAQQIKKKHQEKLLKISFQ